MENQNTRLKATFQQQLIMNTQTIVLNIISWLFGMAVLAVGLINTFFGSDPGFEVFPAFQYCIAAPLMLILCCFG